MFFMNLYDRTIPISALAATTNIRLMVIYAALFGFVAITHCLPPGSSLIKQRINFVTHVTQDLAASKIASTGVVISGWLSCMMDSAPASAIYD